MFVLLTLPVYTFNTQMNIHLSISIIVSGMRKQASFFLIIDMLCTFFLYDVKKKIHKMIND